MKDSIQCKIQDLPSICVVPKANSLRFIIAVPKFSDGESPLNPETNEGLTSWDGKPLKGEGFVFFNAQDKSYQFVQGTGNKVMILNGMTLEDQDALLSITEDICDSPSLGMIKSMYRKLKDYCASKHKVLDIYDSDFEYVNTNMVTAGEISEFGSGFRVRNRDTVNSWYLAGQQSLQGPTASAQQYEDGAFVVCHKGEFRAVHPEAFVNAYQNIDGTPVSKDDYLKPEACAAAMVSTDL